MNIDKILELREKATQGEWEAGWYCVDELETEWPYGDHCMTSKTCEPITGNYDYNGGGILKKDDIEYICELHNQIPELIANYKKALEKLEEVLSYSNPDDAQYKIAADCLQELGEHERGDTS